MTELDKLNDFYHRAMDLAHDWGLDPYPVDFHVVPAHRVYEIASYGVPGHFSHWTYGRDYWKQKTSYDKGHGRIYELVINSDPSQAFLLDTNSELDNLFVIAHVLGHTDFFRRNRYFENTNRSIEVTTAAAASRVREYELEFGRDIVEDFISDVFTIKEHIDTTPRLKRKGREYEIAAPTDPYDDLFPEETMIREALREDTQYSLKENFPPEPEKDLVGFIMQYGKLKDWQRDIMGIIREEMQYFLPQMQTKIMNEGWASIMHHEMMHHFDVDCDPAGIDFADVHSSVLSNRPGALNPYLLGYNMYRDIIHKTNSPVEEGERPKWQLSDRIEPKSDGWYRAIEVMKTERDESFVRNYLSETVCEELDLFSYGFEAPESAWVVHNTEWEAVRDALAASKGNMGMPYIQVVNGDGDGSGTLVVNHVSDGRPLDLKWASKTLEAVSRLWGKKVMLVSYDKDGDEIYLECSPNSSTVKLESKRGSTIL